MDTTQDILGYRVLYLVGEQFVDFTDGRNVLTREETTLIRRGDAFRRLAAFLDENPDVNLDDVAVEPVLADE